MYFIKLNLSACILVCLFGYTNPQFLTGLNQSWYDASLGQVADQRQVANAFDRGAKLQVTSLSLRLEVLVSGQPLDRFRPKSAHDMTGYTMRKYESKKSG